MSDLPANSPRMMRLLNCEAVLRHALDADQITAGEIMEITGLTRATVLGVFSDLVEQGWLRERSEPGPVPTVRGGRPAKLYRVPSAAGLLVGLDAGEHRMRAAVTDLRGERRVVRQVVLDARIVTGGSGVAGAGGSGSGDSGAAGSDAERWEANWDPQEVARQRRAVAATLVAELLDEIGARPEDVLLSVVGVPAPVDVNGHSPTGDKGFWAAMNPGFTDVLPGRVVVENDANLAAIAEYSWILKEDDDGVSATDDGGSDSDGGSGRGGDVGGHEGVGDHEDVNGHEEESGRESVSGNVATLLSGERLGAGLIVDGRLLRGARGGAGELRALDLIGDAGSSYGFGALARQWAQEMVAGRDSAAGRGVSGDLELDQDGTPREHNGPFFPLPEDGRIGAEWVFEAATHGDPRAQEIIERLGQRLATVALVVGTLLDVSKVVIAGALADAAEPVIQAAREQVIGKHYPPVPEIVASRLGGDVVVHGAIEQARNLLRANPLSFTPAGG
ncbi:MAG: ROK family protein [Ancrocorticia sp.]